VAGISVTLSNATAEMPVFTAPNAVGDVLVFKLQVFDGKELSTLTPGTDSSQADTVAITIVANSRPIANAGFDQTKDEGNVVVLDGTGSFDPDGGDILTFQWSQIGAPPVALSDTTSPTPTFTTPNVGPGGEDLTFQLVVTDNDPLNPLAALPDEVIIHVRNQNDPPNCVGAKPNLEVLWPPNHGMVPVEIQNLVDPENDTLTLTINGVTQDESVSGLSSGDSSPDAVIQPGDPFDSVFLRAERDRKGNGRVYVINFTASDGVENCTGSALVTVPPKRQSIAIDDGQNYDSTQP